MKKHSQQDLGFEFSNDFENQYLMLMNAAHYQDVRFFLMGQPCF